MNYKISEHMFITLCFVGLMSYYWTSYLVYELQFSAGYFSVISLSVLAVGFMLVRRARTLTNGKGFYQPLKLHRII